MLFVIDFELYITGIGKAARFSIYAALTNLGDNGLVSDLVSRKKKSPLFRGACFVLARNHAVMLCILYDITTIMM